MLYSKSANYKITWEIPTCMLAIHFEIAHSVDVQSNNRMNMCIVNITHMLSKGRAYSRIVCVCVCFGG